MAKSESFQDLVLMAPKEGRERWRWLYGELRAAILDGRLKSGMRLPSTRHLARQYSVARGTVTAAFDQLRAEGYTVARQSAGTYVAFGLPERSMMAKASSRNTNLPASTAVLSRRALKMIEGVRLLPASHSVGKAFRTYEPAIDLFPVNLWAQIAGRVLRRAPRSLYGQGAAGGYEPLRKAICEYLGAARGVRCNPRQVIVLRPARNRHWTWRRGCCLIRATPSGWKIPAIPARASLSGPAGRG